MMRKIEHIGIAVKDLKKNPMSSLPFYWERNTTKQNL